MKNRVTKRLETGEAYFEGHNGKASSDIKGRIFGEAADRLAWIEDKIAEGSIDDVINLYFPKEIKLMRVIKVSDDRTMYMLTTKSGHYVDVMHSKEDGHSFTYVMQSEDGYMTYDETGIYRRAEINEQEFVDFVRNIINNKNNKG